MCVAAIILLSIMLLMVDNIPTFISFKTKNWYNKFTIVVFPFVPVTPTKLIFFDGFP